MFANAGVGLLHWRVHAYASTYAQKVHRSTRTHKRIRLNMARIPHSSHQEKTPGAAAVGTDGGAVAVGASGRKRRRRGAGVGEDAEQLQLQQQQAAR